MLVLEKIREYAKTGRTALVNRDERMTFAELDARSEAFAAWLLGRFGNDRAPVVICGEKESNFLPCILGALKSGRSYVPIDSIIPFQRADEILAAVKPSVIGNFTDLPLETSGRCWTPKPQKFCCRPVRASRCLKHTGFQAMKPHTSCLHPAAPASRRACLLQPAILISSAKVCCLGTGKRAG